MNRQGQGNVKHALVFLALFLFLGVSACNDPEIACEDSLGCIAVERGDPIRIGAMAALSGHAAFLGEDSQHAVEMAILDRDNTLLDHTIELVVTDSGCDAEVAKIATELVVEDEDVIGIIGPTCSVAAETAVPIVESLGLILISPAATASHLTNPDPGTGGLWQPGFYRTVPSDTYQAQVAADFAYNQLEARTAAIIYDETAVSQDLHHAFTDAFQNFGGQITVQHIITPGDDTVTEILRSVDAAKPDVLYLPVFEPEANLIASRIPELIGLGTVNLIGGMGLFNERFPVSVGAPVINGMYILGPVVDDQRYAAFLARWNGRYAQPPLNPYTAHAYDATNLLLDTIESVAQVDNRGNILIGLQAMRDQMTATDDYSGVTGQLHCTATGDCAALPGLGVYQISREEINGNHWPPELVWEPSYE
ncbi:MAG: branched-chain amino acid ABC transporter substrate-binding protein [Anaerolineae bacterium]|nr:branched-chain amino acid ABC transporter substrate-binding protein [Anaerolineae bacterium]